MGLNKQVTFSTAKLLKEKGINIWSEYRYTDFNGVERLEKEVSEIFPYAPTISDVVMWLYEKHGIWIYSRQVRKPVPLPDYWCCIINKDAKLIESVEGYTSPTEAYETAIEYTLNHLI